MSSIVMHWHWRVSKGPWTGYKQTTFFSYLTITLCRPRQQPPSDYSHWNFQPQAKFCWSLVLQRALTIIEFQMAFTIYKNLMTDAFPQSKEELDASMRDTYNQNVLGGLGYAFLWIPRSFSASASALLLNQNIKIDWSIRDNNLFCSIFADHKANAYAVCKSWPCDPDKINCTVNSFFHSNWDISYHYWYGSM